MSVEPELVVDLPCHTGEGPLWHPEEKCLYWVDIPNGKLFRYDPATGNVETFDTSVPVGGFTLHEDGRLMLFMAGGAVRLWDHGSVETVIESLPEERDNRFNDVIADPEGRVFCGVMSTPDRNGRLYRLDPDGTIAVMLENTRTANGMGFSPDLKHMYFCDSGTSEISVFDYDRATGGLSARRRVAVLPASEGRPDGMTVDADGYIWSARWDGSRLVRMDPSGNSLDVIHFPVKKVSCVTFGGDDLTDIYVSTAGGYDTDANGKLAGSLFRLNIGVRGKPEFRSRCSGSRQKCAAGS